MCACRRRQRAYWCRNPVTVCSSAVDEGRGRSNDAHEKPQGQCEPQCAADMMVTSPTWWPPNSDENYKGDHLMVADLSAVDKSLHYGHTIVLIATATGPIWLNTPGGKGCYYDNWTLANIYLTLTLHGTNDAHIRSPLYNPPHVEEGTEGMQQIGEK